MKRLISIILSVAVASVFTACKDDYDGWLPDNPDKPHITETISPTDIKIDAAGTPQTMTVALNDDWTITNIPTWLRFSVTKGYAEQEYTITVTAEENSSTSSRTATCRLYRGNSNQYETLSAKQDAHYLKINGTAYSSSFSFYSSTDIKKVTISSSAKWTAKSTQPWIVLSQTEGLPGETILTISTKKTSTTTSTSGQIDFYIGDTRFNSIYTYLRY
jgi:hypothetical protein